MAELFGQPLWLWGAWGLVPLAGVLWHDLRLESRRRSRFAAARLLLRAGVLGTGGMRFSVGLARLLALGLLLVALAAPGQGGQGAEQGHRADDRLAVVLDLSRSMLAQDMPGGVTRLAAAQALQSQVLGHLVGTQVCAVVFAKNALLACPLTTDVSAASILLMRPEADLTPGTDIAQALRVATRALGRKGRILLLTDGEELSGDALAAASPRVPIWAVGFGTAAGAPIPEGTDVWGQPRYHRFQGQIVQTALHADLLQGLAQRSAGRYMPGTRPDLAEVLGRQLSGKVTPRAGRHTSDAGFQWPLMLALLILGLEGILQAIPVLEERWMSRKTWGWTRSGSALIGLLALAQLGWTWPWTIVQNQDGVQAMEHHQYVQAEASFRAALANGSDVQPLYNLGEALYQEGRYPQAQQAFTQALQRMGSHKAWQERCLYDLGNALFQESRARSDAEGFAQAAVRYRQALALDPHDQDAAHNLALAEAQQGPSPTGSGAGAGNGQQGAGTARSDLPSEAEVDSVLAALQQDERTRMAQARPPRTPDQSASSILDQLLRNGAPPPSSPDTPDW